jgi:hypothetical protein
MWKLITIVFLINPFFWNAYCLARPVLNAHEKISCQKASSDPPLRICELRRWYLIGNPLTPGHDSLHFTVDRNKAFHLTKIELDNEVAGSIINTSQGYKITIDISGLDAGSHSLTLFASNKAKPILRWRFVRSHPLYVLFTTDWDSSDSKDAVLRRHIQLHAEHPFLRITHFLGPYTFTDPEISASRKAYLADWMRHMNKVYQDEIGLHIHPFCNFVSTVPDVDCLTRPSDTYRKGDQSGYTVLSSAYSEADYSRLLQMADKLFLKYGLNKPTAFRAGSWAANANTLKALASNGFVADSSANNWLRIKNESEHEGNGVLYRWNRKHWLAINDLSQPYLPSEASPMKTGFPAIPILEVPDNGCLVDYVTAHEMIAIFSANWQRRALPQPVTFVMGFHPISYDNIFHKRIEATLRYIDKFIFDNDDGPVVYETLSHMTKVFPIYQLN